MQSESGTDLSPKPAGRGEPLAPGLTDLEVAPGLTDLEVAPGLTDLEGEERGSFSFSPSFASCELEGGLLLLLGAACEWRAADGELPELTAFGAGLDGAGGVRLTFA